MQQPANIRIPITTICLSLSVVALQPYTSPQARVQLDAGLKIFAKHLRKRNIYKIYKNLNLRKEVEITIKVRKQVISLNQLEIAM